jgi:ABC-type antimicrobial peptide transport system permease subunit
VDPNLPVERLRTLDEQIWDNTTRDRVLATLSSSFAGLATLLAGIGLYAVLAFTVAQRLREFGIRMALGARAGDVRRMVFAQVGRMAMVGGAIGLTAAIGLGRLAQGVLFGVEGSSPALIGGVGALVALVTFGAAALPALRASRVSPVLALRAE